MKNKIIFCILIAVSLNINAQENIKIITYNILEGLGNEASYGVGRHDSCVQFLKSQQADVIALQELYNSEKLLSEDAEKWGHKYSVKLGGVGLTSRMPIKQIKKYKAGFWHGVLVCQTYDIVFITLHLSPADWKMRAQEAELIKDIVDSVKQTTDKYILLGDFNSHSPFDCELYEQHPELLAKYQKSDKNQELKGISHRNTADNYLDYSVMSKFLSFPLIDVTQRFVPWYNRYTFPSPILIGVWRTAGNIGRTPERIDYILSSPELSKSFKNVIIHNNETNDYISDHYPVEANLKIIQ